MGLIAPQTTSLTIVYSNVQLGVYQRKHQSSTPLAFVWGIRRWPVNFPHKGPVTRKMFSFDDVIVKFSTNIPHNSALRMGSVEYGEYCRVNDGEI